jgi:hypothetical protein
MIAHLDLLVLRVAGEPLRRFALLDTRPYRLSEEGVRRSYIGAELIKLKEDSRRSVISYLHKPHYAL